MAEKSAKVPLWTAPFTLLTLANFGLSMAFFSLMATMATYSIHAFAASNTQAGVVNSAFVLGAMISRFVAGRLIELKGYRAVMIASLILHAAAIASYFTATTFTWTLIIRTLHGIGFGLSQTAVGGTVMATVPASRRAEGSGWFTTGMSIATGLAPFLGSPCNAPAPGKPGCSPSPPRSPSDRWWPRFSPAPTPTKHSGATPPTPTRAPPNTYAGRVSPCARTRLTWADSLTNEPSPSPPW